MTQTVRDTAKEMEHNIKDIWLTLLGGTRILLRGIRVDSTKPIIFTHVRRSTTGFNGVKMATNHRFLDGLGVFDHHRGTDLVASISNNSAVQRNVVGLLFQTFFTCICARNSVVATLQLVK